MINYNNTLKKDVFNDKIERNTIKETFMGFCCTAGENGELIDPLSDYNITYNKADTESILEAICELNPTKITHIYTTHNLVFYYKKSFWQYIHNIDIADFLQIENPKSFCCILHDDHNPSASIFYDIESERWRYKCFSGCTGDRAISLEDLVCRIASCSISEALSFLSKVFCITYENKKRTTTETKITKLLYVLQAENFKEKYPYLNKQLGIRKKYLTKFLKEFKENNYADYNGCYFCKPYAELTELFGVAKRNVVSECLASWTTLGIIKKVEFKELPENLKKEAIRIKNINNYKKIPNYYIVYNSLFEELETRAKELTELNFKSSACNREFIRTTLGKNEADKLFPQDRELNEICQNNEKLNQAEFDELCIYINEKIEAVGYITEKEIKQNYNYVKLYETYKNEIFNSYDLKRIRSTKSICDSLNVSYIRGFLVIKNEAESQASE